MTCTSIAISERIYAKVCMLYFKAGFSRLEISDLMEGHYNYNLLYYRHHTNEGIISFHTRLDVVNAILDCEMKAHRQATEFANFKPIKQYEN